MKFKNQIAWMLMALIAAMPIANAGPFVSGQVLTANQLNTVVDSKTDNAAAAITGGTITGVTINNSTIGATTATTGKFTTLQVTGAFTPSAVSGVVGTITNDNAAAGSWGEYSVVSAASSAVSLTTATPADLVSKSLTAGDYDVQGICVYQTAASTSVTQNHCGISTTSATLGTAGSYSLHTFAAVVPGAAEYMDIPTPVFRVSLAATTTIYLVGQSAFTVSTQTAGGVIRTRRVR